MKLMKTKEECMNWSAPHGWALGMDRTTYEYLKFLLSEIEYERECVKDGFEDTNLDALRAYIYAWEISYNSFAN